MIKFSAIIQSDILYEHSLEIIWRHFAIKSTSRGVIPDLNSLRWPFEVVLKFLDCFCIISDFLCCKLIWKARYLKHISIWKNLSPSFIKNPETRIISKHNLKT